MTLAEIEKLQRLTEQYGATHANQVQQNLTMGVLEVARQLAILNHNRAGGSAKKKSRKKK